MAVLHDRRPCAPRLAQAKKPTQTPDPIVLDFLKDTLVDFDPEQVAMHNGTPVYAAPKAALAQGVAFSCGVTIGEVRKNYIQPHHQFFMALGPKFRRRVELAGEDLERYLHGEEISVDGPNGWAVVTTHGCTLGGVKIVNGRAKNHYPKGLRKL